MSDPLNMPTSKDDKNEQVTIKDEDNNNNNDPIDGNVDDEEKKYINGVLYIETKEEKELMKVQFDKLKQDYQELNKQYNEKKSI